LQSACPVEDSSPISVPGQIRRVSRTLTDAVCERSRSRARTWMVQPSAWIGVRPPGSHADCPLLRNIREQIRTRPFQSISRL
jgi:hypothetical protein